MYRDDLALNNLKWLICHKTKPNQTNPNIRIFICFVFLSWYYDDFYFCGLQEY